MTSWTSSSAGRPADEPPWRLRARPSPERPASGPSDSSGGAVAHRSRLALTSGRDGLTYAPPRLDPDAPAPLILLLHGAGAHAADILPVLEPLADTYGLVLVVPDSRRVTWDLLLGRLGPDVAFIDAALEQTFARHHVDPSRVAIAGFSDGASYALSLGIANAALFTHVLAFSPGFVRAPEPGGMPRIFVSHGERDTVLPIEPCSRRIVPRLERQGFTVRYEEFADGHAVPPTIAAAAVAWMLASPRVEHA
jgi:phospholipase/carboxylesterase